MLSPSGARSCARVGTTIVGAVCFTTLSVSDSNESLALLLACRARFVASGVCGGLGCEERLARPVSFSLPNSTEEAAAVVACVVPMLISAERALFCPEARTVAVLGAVAFALFLPVAASP
uniref:Uncharacterized protein n=1 Tax=Alexandrium catenella TaxID=2925 RepID=A0A7S1WTF6_ALECA|mmetsp:Transcript_88780/g.235815  ORF Transcript_88780/g.235815 Transcript_88780/m.235815 type:complete len:120 (+) Transcript_88780:238-597(+)